jgi:CRP-like cAMP-binding protein
MFSKFKLALEKDIQVSPELWDEIQGYAKIVSLQKNEYLLKAGEVCKQGYFINKGSLIKTYLNYNGREVVHGFYIDTDYAFLSEASSYFNKIPSDFQIKAIENCNLIEFSEKQLEHLAQKYKDFELFYNRITLRSYQNLYMFSAMRLSLSAEEFLLFLYQNHPIYISRIPDKYIAQFMGLSKEWYSKLKKKVLKDIH